MTQHNTQLPTSVELCGKSKWEVRRTRTLGGWEVWNPNTLQAAYFLDWREAMGYIDEQTQREQRDAAKWRVERHPTTDGSEEHVWCAFHNEDDIEETYRHFPTWQEAMDYADKQARTIEMTLPRVLYGDRVIAGKGLYSLHVDYRPHCTDITLGGWDGVTVENSHLRGLSVYLAACAKHWEEHQ